MTGGVWDPTLRREWIRPPFRPSPVELDALRQAMQQTGVVSAWLAGMVFFQAGEVIALHTVLAVVLDDNTTLDRIEPPDLNVSERHHVVMMLAGRGSVYESERHGLETTAILLTPCFG